MSKLYGRVFAEKGKKRLVAVEVTHPFPINTTGEEAEPGDILLLDLEALNVGWHVVDKTYLYDEYVKLPEPAVGHAGTSPNG